MLVALQMLTISKMKSFDTAFGLRYRNISKTTDVSAFAARVLAHVAP